MNKRNFIFSETNLVVFLCMFLCTVVILFVVLFLCLMRWDQLFSKYLSDHLHQTLSRISGEIMRNDLFPPLSESKTKRIIEFAAREGTLIRWESADRSIVLDMFTAASDSVWNHSQRLTVPLWSRSIYYGQLYIDWASENENSYPSYSINREVNQGFLISGCIAVFFSIILCFFASMMLTKPLFRITKQLEMLFNKKKLPPFAEKGTQEIVRLAKGFNYLSAQLDEQEKWRQVLMEDLAHELRTPLSIVSNQIEAIVDGVFEADQERLETILSDISRLTRLVNNIERFIQANGAQFKLNTEVTDIVPLVKQAVVMVEESFKAKNITWVLNTPKIPCPVRVDVDKLIQVLLNLLYNAIKYTLEDGCIEVGIEACPGDKVIVVHIKDNGIGISQEDLPNIFERFYRGKKSGSEMSGLGLGLTISKRLIEAHDGKIEVKSTLGVGSQFTIVVPVLPYAD
jgi:two-component system sensor histidine kinase BaeS